MSSSSRPSDRHSDVAATTPPGLPACPFCGGELCAVELGAHWNVPGVSCGGCGAYTSRLPMRKPWLYEGRKASGGDPDEVLPSDSRAESQAGLNGPGGSPTSPPERASAASTAAQNQDAGGWIPKPEGWSPNPEWTAEECLRVAMGKLSVRSFPNETTRDKIRIQRVWEARRCLSAALNKIEDAYERGYRDAVDLYSGPRRA